MQTIPRKPNSDRLSFSEQFTPKLLTILRDGYRLANFRSDLLAGLTVAVVALPLSMAIAIASGVSPAHGLTTAIVGGVLVSALGGSRFQIGGPAGAFIVLVAATVSEHGMEGLVLATLLSGVFLALAGWLRLGTYIKFVPYPVTVGFTAGIAVIIAASQLKNILGLHPPGPEPGELIHKLPWVWQALPSTNYLALGLAAGTVAVIQLLRRLNPRAPAMLIAVIGAGLLVTFLKLPVATIGTDFGGIPRSLPTPHLPNFGFEKFAAVLPSAIAFTLLGAIESLLSAVVADGMTGRRHRSNCELVAQGAANVGSALFGGMCVTGTVARTATNVRAGAHGPIAGILHALFLLAFLLVAAPLASAIPLAALAGILAVVAWDMIEKHAFWMLLRASRGDAAVLLATFGMTIFRDLTEAIVVGFSLGSALFIRRMSQMSAVESSVPLMPRERADDPQGERQPYDESTQQIEGIVIYRVSGAMFFGAAAKIGAVLDRVGEREKAMIFDFSKVPFADATAANTIALLANKAQSRGVVLYLSGISESVRRYLYAHELQPPRVEFADSIDDALLAVRARIASSDTDPAASSG